MDVAELSRPMTEQMEQLHVAQLLSDRIITIGRSLLGSNRNLDVITYRLSNTQDPDYVTELIEHTGPREAYTVLHGRGERRTVALWLLFDRAERELNATMSQARLENGVTVINTRRLGGHRCNDCNSICGGGPAV